MLIMKIENWFNTTSMKRIVPFYWEKAAYCIMIVFSFYSLNSAYSLASELQPSNASQELSDNEKPFTESPPIAFNASYFGLLINQNYGLEKGHGKFRGPKTSWGAEYRFFYKDQWTLALSGEFKGQEDESHSVQSTYSISQETQRIVRIYHPWYLSAGGRISYNVPVRRISIPYERDQERSVDTGGDFSIGSILILNDRFLIMISAHRWISFSTQKNQGVHTAFSMLTKIR